MNPSVLTSRLRETFSSRMLLSLLIIFVLGLSACAVVGQQPRRRALRSRSPYRMIPSSKISIHIARPIALFNGAIYCEYSTAHFTGWPSASDLYVLAFPVDSPDNEITLLHLQPVS